MNKSRNGAANGFSPLERILASGKVEALPPADPAAIARYETRYGVRFSQPYKDFLAIANGMYLEYHSEEVEEADLHMALADITILFGIGNGDGSADLELVTPRWGFYDDRLLPFAPAIGVGGDHCTYSEVTSGRFAGQIMYTDGEMFPSYIREVVFEGKTVDELVEDFIEAGWFMPVAPSFDALLALYAQVS